MAPEPSAKTDTSVGQVRCPSRNFHRKGEQVHHTGGNVYRCSCGCRFRWESEFQWRILPADGGQPGE